MQSTFARISGIGLLVAAGCAGGRYQGGPGGQGGQGGGPRFDAGLSEFPPKGDGGAAGPQPTFGPTISQPKAPPPLSGGTLLALRTVGRWSPRTPIAIG